jgi:hypothetical protein
LMGKSKFNPSRLYAILQSIIQLYIFRNFLLFVERKGFLEFGQQSSSSPFFREDLGSFFAAIVTIEENKHLTILIKAAKLTSGSFL